MQIRSGEGVAVVGAARYIIGGCGATVSVPQSRLHVYYLMGVGHFMDAGTHAFTENKEARRKLISRPTVRNLRLGQPEDHNYTSWASRNRRLGSCDIHAVLWKDRDTKWCLTRRAC
jgi:hypothetical protein